MTDDPYPAICLPAGFHEDQPASIPPGNTVTFVGLVVDDGPAVPDATVVINLPPQLQITAQDQVARVSVAELDSDDAAGTPLACTQSSGGAQVSCATGAIAQGERFFLAVDLSTRESAAPGTSATFTVSLQPTPGNQSPGVPEFPATSVSAIVDVLVPSHLVVGVTPARASVRLGSSVTLTATVRNAGSGAAPDTVLVALTLPDPPAGTDAHFAITNAPAGATTFLVNLRQQGRPVRQVRTAGDSGEQPAIAVWPVGELAPGQRGSVAIRLRAVTVGRAVLTVSAITSTTDADCNEDAGPSCQNDAAADLTAVAPAATSHPRATRSPTTGSSSPVLADTGPRDPRGLTLLGLLALLAGLALVRIGRTGRPPGRRH